MSDVWGKVGALASGDHARGCQGRSYTCECGHDDAMQGALSFAKVEIARLHAELAEARDKALDEAALVCETHMKQFLDDNDVRKMWPATQARNDVYAGLIRALKSPKPQEATMSEGVGG